MGIFHVDKKVSTAHWRHVSIGCTYPRNCDITGSSWVVSLTLRPLYSGRRVVLYPLDRKLDESQYHVERRDSCPCGDSISDPSALQPIACVYTGCAFLCYTNLRLNRHNWSSLQFVVWHTHKIIAPCHCGNFSDMSRKRLCIRQLCRRLESLPSHASVVSCGW
jgi:hypothetical protein